ncbi:MAG: hemerythrin domain-containing protein [Pseudomonadota bacterium]
MRRSAWLQPLSREHHHALSLAKQCTRAAASGDAVQIAAACQAALQGYAAQLMPHFQVEERELLPLLGPAQQALVQRTLTEHARLRELCGGLQRQDVAALAAFGSSLAEHVRFEETALFPVLEAIGP